MTDTRVPSIVVLGGGSAGWITAAILHQMLCQGRKDVVRITLVESPSIGIIGVGEATLPGIKMLMKFLGIGEAELMSRTQATFKHGIHYRDWEKPGAAYFHPFDPIRILNVNAALWWAAERAGLPNAKFAEDVYPQYRLAAAGKTPRRPDMPEYEGIVGYGYHLDAEALAKLLAEKFRAAGVTQILDKVVDTRLAENGDVAAVVTAEHGEIEADFFVDCSGFASLLLSKALGAGFNSYAETLFCDRAIAFRVPAEGRRLIRPFTTATARGAGWIWDIDLRERSGIGYVYSSRHISDDDAEMELHRYVGVKAKDLTARRLHMRVGHSRTMWLKNVIAIGLSGGFIEPLESSGLLLIEVAAIHMAESIVSILSLKTSNNEPGGGAAFHESLASASAIFNKRMNDMYEELRDFIKLHYCLTQRRDTPFWRDNANERTYPESLREMLSRWKNRPPQPFDFPNRLNQFSESNWLCILFGMGWKPDNAEALKRFVSAELGQHLLAKIARRAQEGIASMPDHDGYFKSMEDLKRGSSNVEALS